VLRIFRLIRVARLMREVGARTLFTTLIKDRANSTLMTLLLLGILVLEFGSISILAVEVDAEGANITSASDALWYTVVTISTVGYGDQYPVTNAGRIIGTGIIIVGVGIFGTFTGYLANLFLGPSKLTGDSGADAGTDDSAVPEPQAEDAAAPVAAVTHTDEPKTPTAAVTVPDDASRLEELLALQEQTVAEIRQLVAGGRS
jgi:voltage-gated potassium channel